ncbi:MAG: hypothetical protein ACI8QS_000649 [Planctomycetota bacterium]|jgi:hypothetical protein
MLLLAQHPQVVALQQTDFFRTLRRFGCWWREDQQWGMSVLHLPNSGDAEAELSKEGLVREKLGSVQPMDSYYSMAREVATDVFERFRATKDGATTVVDQTPENVQAWEEILEVFPDAIFLHMIRDPRSVFASYRGAVRAWGDPRHFPTDPAEFAEEWKRDVFEARKIGAQTDAYVEVRFEDLKHEGAPKLLELLNKLGLDGTEESAQAALDACSIEKLRQADHGPQGFFRKGEVDGWKNDLTKSQIQAIEFLLQEPMTELGYELSNGDRVSAPMGLRIKRAVRSTKDNFAKWAWSSEGPVRRLASKSLRRMPGLRRVLLRTIDKPN